MNKLAISAVNLVSGGPLTVLLEVAKSFNNSPFDRVDIYTNDKSLFFGHNTQGVNLIEIKYPKKNWLYRFIFEYIDCYRIAKRNKYTHWLSLHDMSPILPKNIKQFVYCHNPSPFYKMSISDIRLDWKMYCFTKLYKYLYRININSNSAIIVQQHWIGEQLSRLTNQVSVIVCQPSLNIKRHHLTKENRNSEKTLIVYPALPRSFKNFEVIIEATKIINCNTQLKINVEFTITGDENPYAKKILKQSSNLDNVKLIGNLTHEAVLQKISASDLFIFPSKLETWGLPITEAKYYEKPIILSNLPYAKETLGSYDNASFFEPDNPDDLASQIIKCINNNYILNKITYQEPNKAISSWSDLWCKIL
ncbi:glycosyltransferase [Pseudocolwellia sp. AS88]|uniref:glycosyltransferase n=1 Tax=Pseudocolwellia sp. AS88 TaxID=3063958 RepID=UPI0026EE093E|nr:glycosyltransferase [Pseudocolwellia sp. AS88]MDO7085028.1 glycosyltransferase [Pseudocolwellia sp. AS88]